MSFGLVERPVEVGFVAHDAAEGVGADARLVVALECSAHGSWAVHVKGLREVDVVVHVAWEVPAEDVGFHSADASSAPVAEEHLMEAEEFCRPGWFVLLVEGLREVVEGLDVFSRRMASWAQSPCFRELRRTLALPSGVRGPVLFCALRRFASNCLSEGICPSLGKPVPILRMGDGEC